MGSGLYAASKAIAVSDLITTVTPERRGEDRMGEHGKKQPIRGDMLHPLIEDLKVSSLFLYCAVSLSADPFPIFLSPPLLSYHLVFLFPVSSGGGAGGAGGGDGGSGGK